MSSSSRNFFKQIVRQNEGYFPDLLHKFGRNASPSTTLTCYPRTVHCKCTLNLPIDKSKDATHPSPTTYTVLAMDTLDAAQTIHDRCLVLNMASDRTPGGGYKNGALAQEESLFYRTTLSQVIPTQHYPLDTYAALWSPQVIVFRDSQYNVLEYDQCFAVDILSMAAVRYHSPKDQPIMAQKIHGLCRAAKNLKYDTVLLGAFGCGAFHNPPEVVAAMFRHILPLYNFRAVYFAIIGNNENFEVFKRVFSQ